MNSLQKTRDKNVVWKLAHVVYRHSRLLSVDKNDNVNQCQFQTIRVAASKTRTDSASQVPVSTAVVVKKPSHIFSHFSIKLLYHVHKILVFRCVQWVFLVHRKAFQVNWSVTHPQRDEIEKMLIFCVRWTNNSSNTITINFGGKAAIFFQFNNKHRRFFVKWCTELKSCLKRRKQMLL